jgi:nucleotide-binding universal stress UspA family protein
MIKNIVVPTDFSDCSYKAVDFAVQAARMLSVEIILLHALDVEENLYTDYMGVNKEFNQSRINDAQNKLAQLKKNIKTKEGIEVSAVLSKKSLNKAILEITEQKDISLILMGTLGANRIKKIFWGSNTSSVIGKSKVPVMVIPGGYKWTKPERILFATNHFETDKSILDFLFEMADLFMAQVQVVVFSDEENTMALTYVEDSRNLSHYEKIIRAKYNEKSLTTIHLRGEDFQQTLENYINDNEIDILSMINYKKGFLESILHKSMTKSMSYHTKIPLLVIPAKH